MKRLVVATWNIHGCVGIDRRRDPARIADALARMRADVVALQEFAAPRGGLDELRLRLESRLGMRAYSATTFRTERREFGNAVLSRWPIVDARCVDLSFAAREPRNAIELVLDVEGATLRVIATHLGLGAAERRAQVARLATRLAETDVPTILLGDFNEPRRRGSLAGLQSCVELSATPATFPSWCPLLRLDRVFSTAPLRAILRVQRDRDSRLASDHLPLLADIGFPEAVGEPTRTAATQRARSRISAGSDEEAAP